ncbi:transmembrane protein 14C-like protein [Powellomyces hirtus]|nr:transmembrane protein 14C-like protein [Powellomyces hirtus]
MPPKVAVAYPTARTDYFAYAYAALIFVGGVVGFIKAGSLISLLMGTVTGTLLGIGARQASADPSRIYLLLAISTALMVVMGMRYANSGVFMPAGLVSVISGVFFTRYGIRLANEA